jgi:hypothetical protein
VQWLHLELQAAQDTGRRALPLLPAEAVAERADLLMHMVAAYYLSGRFADVDALLPEVERLTSRLRDPRGPFIRQTILSDRDVMRTGDLRAFLAQTEHMLVGSIASFSFLLRTSVAITRLYLGQIEDALDQLAVVAAEPQFSSWRNMVQPNLFAGTALAGRADRARTLVSTVQPCLPVLGRRNIVGAWIALEATVTGLALVGDRERCGALYPLTIGLAETGLVCDYPFGVTVGPTTPQLVAAMAADAAGHSDRAREHFETALRQARELPHRILQPTVLYWYGRALSDMSDAGHQARGRAMVEGALTDFRALEMVTHANLAEQFLRR